ncbi:pentapeptide repeat-containing protein [Phenylobacterium sp.]|uniref:pentapeptide repeat-containing protein n=1 Tax=Phenylobacterium sp. TaxID=1871053 RepID=UPI0035AE9257
MTGLDFSGFDVSKAIISDDRQSYGGITDHRAVAGAGASFQGANFSDANFAGAMISSLDLGEADFSGASFTKTVVQRSDIAALTEKAGLVYDYTSVAGRSGGASEREQFSVRVARLALQDVGSQDMAMPDATSQPVQSGRTTAAQQDLHTLAAINDQIRARQESAAGPEVPVSRPHLVPASRASGRAGRPTPPLLGR